MVNKDASQWTTRTSEVASPMLGCASHRKITMADKIVVAVIVVVVTMMIKM